VDKSAGEILELLVSPESLNNAIMDGLKEYAKFEPAVACVTSLVSAGLNQITPLEEKVVADVKSFIQTYVIDLGKKTFDDMVIKQLEVLSESEKKLLGTNQLTNAVQSKISDVISDTETKITHLLVKLGADAGRELIDTGKVANSGHDCWTQCNSKQGPCAFCGSGLCCRKGWTQDYSGGCDGTVGVAGRGHVCSAASTAGCSWESHSNKFSTGFANGDSIEYTLGKAKTRCLALGDKCKAITCSKGGTCTVRGSTKLGNSPSGETTYVPDCSSKPGRCGAPDVNWATVTKGPTAPPGWTTSGFNGNVGNDKGCANGWNAYANGANQGSLVGTLEGNGRATVVYADCWKEGFVGLYVNGVKKDQTADSTGAVKTYSFDFSDGDKLMFKDEGRNAVVWIKSITYDCGAGDKHVQSAKDQRAKEIKAFKESVKNMDKQKLLGKLKGLIDGSLSLSNLLPVAFLSLQELLVDYVSDELQKLLPVAWNAVMNVGGMVLLPASSVALNIGLASGSVSSEWVSSAFNNLLQQVYAWLQTTGRTSFMEAGDYLIKTIINAINAAGAKIFDFAITPLATDIVPSTDKFIREIIDQIKSETNAILEKIPKPLQDAMVKMAKALLDDVLQKYAPGLKKQLGVWTALFQSLQSEATVLVQERPKIEKPKLETSTGETPAGKHLTQPGNKWEDEWEI
jgi:hypothetical protein